MRLSVIGESFLWHTWTSLLPYFGTENLKIVTLDAAYGPGLGSVEFHGGRDKNLLPRAKTTFV